MQAPQHYSPDNEKEYFFQEGCYILELQNDTASPDLSIARARVRPGVTTRLHRLNAVHERYVIVSGQGRAEVGDSLIADVVANDVVEIPAGVSQRITNTGTDDLVFLAICTPRFTPQCYEDVP